MSMTDERPSLANPGGIFHTEPDARGNPRPDYAEAVEAICPPAPTNRTTLPDDEWVVLKDVKSIRQKDRKVVMAAIDRANADDSGAMVGMLSIADRIAGLVVEAWSYTYLDPTDEEAAATEGREQHTVPLPIPRVKLDAMDELSIQGYDAISVLCQPYMDELFPDFTSEAADNESRQGPTGTSVD